MNIPVPSKIMPMLAATNRYQVLHGGRGGAKSHSFAKKAVVEAAFRPLRFLCTREMQNSIRDSVHRLLVGQIYELGFESFFDIQKDSITSTAGAEFIFRGLRHNINEIRSMEGLDRVWCEEAEAISQNSWDILDPTVRKPGSQIWVSFNPEDENSPTYQQFVVKPLPDTLTIEVNYNDNPWFPEVLRRQMEYCKRTDPDKYLWIWKGKPRKFGSASIFKDKIEVEPFEAPDDARFYYGADFGYAQDPSVLVRMHIRDRKLWIDYEAYGVGIELEEMHRFFGSVPGSHRWKITADSARPETISFLSRPFNDKFGQDHDPFNIEGAEKGKGSVEDGLEFLKSFEKIVIHPRCTGTIGDFKSYRWKTDRITGDILPIPIDSSNHSPDACRYALESSMKGGATIWDVLEG